MLLPVLTITLIALMLLEVWVNRGNVLAPSVIFTAGFAFCALWAVAYAAKWTYTMRPTAFAAIGGGVALFALACALTKKFLFHGGEWRPSHSRWDGRVPVWCTVLFLLAQMATGVGFALRVRSMYPAGSISASIAAYKFASTFTTANIYLGFPVSQLRVLCMAAAYVFGYSFACAAARREKSISAALTGATVFVNLVINWESGGRTGIAVYLVYMVVLGMLALREENHGEWKISKRMIIWVGVLAIVFVAAFRLLAIGRHDGFSLTGALDNLSVYCGAEIPSLDLWMRTSRNRANDIWGSMTFIRTITYLGPKLGISAWTYPLDLPHLYSSWHWIGNVYTTFYAFLYDFGPLGLVVLTLAMGCISEVIFCMCGRADRFRDLWMMAYGSLAPQLLLSFFSNKFYEEFLTVGFLRTFILMVIIRALLIAFENPKDVFEKFSRSRTADVAPDSEEA